MHLTAEFAEECNAERAEIFVFLSELSAIFSAFSAFRRFG
jgi:hypothetical protein